MPSTILVPTPALTERPPHRGLSVLIAADRSTGSEVLALTLESLGCDIVTTPLGPSAVDLAQLTQPDAVIVVADRADGAGIPRAIAERAGWRKPFVVVLTARGGADNPGEGVHLAIERPVSPDVLTTVIRRFRRLLAGIDGFDPAI